MKIEAFCTFEDKAYVNLLKSFIGAHSINFNYSAPVSVTGTLGTCDAILISNPAVIKQVTLKSKCNLDDYQGSLWIREDVKKNKKPILAIPPLKQIVSTKPGAFVLRRYLSKILYPEKWFKSTPFQWTLCDDDISISNCFSYLSTVDLIAVDIETSPAYADREAKTNPQHVISCVSYAGVTFGSDGNSFDIRTFVIPCTSVERIKWIRRLNTLPQPKIFQNGKYDNFYFFRFNAPVNNWLFDTLEAHHSFYSELPKNLGYLGAFYIREIAFWKDEGKTGDLHDFYRYNAMDSWATANVFLSWLSEAPEWAIQNYLIKFGLVFPCFACELDGLPINGPTLEKLKREQGEKQKKSLESLRKKIAQPLFNPASPKQVLQLLKLLGNKEFDSSDEKHLEKAGDRHPIARVLVDAILEYRESSKLINTYLEADLWRGKLLYTLNPSGTDTGRLASRESQLWCGTQLQNLPPYYKQAIWAEEGFLLGEGDFAQSESRCTAYLSGDESLIAAVESEKDFHATNASAFFGLSIDEILEEEKRAKEQAVKPFTTRDLSKRVNHGATYNMGERVLLATMGLKNVLRARELLGLPKTMQPLEVCRFLLQRFSDTYPKVKGDFYASIVSAIKLTKKLVSALGWTRLCFGTPWSSKPDLNSYVAHVPSNLSVGIINEAFEEIFWRVYLPSKGDFRLKGQIHDSILFAYREGRLDLVEQVARIMTRPKLITDCSGVTRTMKIPVEIKAEGKTWTSLKKQPQFTF